MIRAQYPGMCWRCDRPINVGDPIYVRRGAWYCVRCASGGDDQ